MLKLAVEATFWPQLIAEGEIFGSVIRVYGGLDVSCYPLFHNYTI
jgi:hypothetical protein